MFFSDEKMFTIDPVRNRQNERYVCFPNYKVADEDKFLEKTKHPASLMMLGVVASTGEVCPPVWFPAGYRLVAKDYVKSLEKMVVPWIMSVMSKYPGRTYVFQQDGAPAHTATITQKYLGKAMASFWAKDFGRHHPLTVIHCTSPSGRM